MWCAVNQILGDGMQCGYIKNITQTRLYQSNCSIKIKTLQEEERKNTNTLKLALHVPLLEWSQRIKGEQGLNMQNKDITESNKRTRKREKG